MTFSRKLDERGEKTRGRFWCGLLLAVTATAVLCMLVSHLWLAVMRINSSGMYPLLGMDKIVLVLKQKTPARNAVIALTHDDKIYVKRVIAMPGDSVVIDSEGVVSVNGKTLEEPYAAQKSLGSCDLEFPYQVPAGAVFVLGDNRQVAMDSRVRRFGPVGEGQVIGKVLFWPRRGKVT